MFVGMARSLLERGATQRCFSKEGSGLIYKHWSRTKHSIFNGPFISFVENKVLRIWSLLIFFDQAVSWALRHSEKNYIRQNDIQHNNTNTSLNRSALDTQCRGAVFLFIMPWLACWKTLTITSCKQVCQLMLMPNYNMSLSTWPFNKLHSYNLFTAQKDIKSEITEATINILNTFAYKHALTHTHSGGRKPIHLTPGNIRINISKSRHRCTIRQ